jgi:hypothetical protein
MATVERKTLTHEEVRQALDEGARSVLGLSAAAFLARYKAGELDLDSPTVLRLTVLARLVLEAEPNGRNGHVAT